MMRGGPFSCASSPAELWPLRNLPGRVFDGVSCTHHTVLRLVHIYVMTTQPSALVPSYHLLLLQQM